MSTFVAKSFDWPADYYRHPPTLGYLWYCWRRKRTGPAVGAGAGAVPLGEIPGTGAGVHKPGKPSTSTIDSQRQVVFDETVALFAAIAGRWRMRFEKGSGNAMPCLITAAGGPAWR